MDYCFLNGFLVVLLIQHCRCEGLSTSNQSLSVVSLQAAQALPREPEVPPADVLPVVAPPSLKEVQQVMQEASEKVEGHTAEDVLKELLEKVAGAAMGKVEEGGKANGDEEAPHEAVRQNAVGAKKEEPDTEEVLEEKEGKDMGAERGGAAEVGKEQLVAEVDAFIGPAEERKGVVKEKELTAAEPVEETTAGIEAGGRDGEEFINTSLDTEASQEEKAAASEETGGDLTAHGAKVEGNNEQVSKEKGTAETEAREAEEPLPVVKVALDKGQESLGRSDPALAVTGMEQLGEVGRKEGDIAEESQVDEMKGEIAMPPSDRYDTEATNTVAQEIVEEEKEAVEEGGGAGNGEAEDTNVPAATGEERDGDREVSEKLVNGEGDQQAGEEARAALETSHGTKTEDRVPENGAEASVEQSLKDLAATPSPPSGGVEHPLDDEKSNHVNEIITPTHLLPNGPAAAQPTLDNFVTDARAQHPQSERGEAGWTNELVEDTAANKETGEPGLDACKIGAISAAAFLIVETAVVVFYIAKCRKKNSTSALQRACEEGCVEPEEATGGDCSDDTLPADNVQIATLDPPDVASTLTRNQEQRGVDHATAMSDFTSSSTEEAGPQPDSSQDLRTSTL